MQHEVSFETPSQVLVNSDELILLQRTVIRKDRFGESAAELAGALLAEHTKLEAYVKLKNVTEIIEVALGQLKEGAILQMPGTVYEVLGVPVQLKGLPKRYEYDDEELQRLEDEKAGLDTRIKGRKRFLEALATEIIDATTGEVIRPAHCISAGVTLQVNF